MLYQLPALAVWGIIALDLGVLTILIQLLRHPRSGTEKWAAIIGVMLVFLPLCGLKLLFSSPGTLASTPGQFTVCNPEHHYTSVYYLLQDETGSWRVGWTEYMWATDQTAVVETEGVSAVRVAVRLNGQWRYAPMRFQELNIAEDITLPQGFSEVDTSGHMSAVVAAYRATEYANLFSNLLTLSCIGLLASVIAQRLALRRARSTDYSTSPDTLGN
ncbi:hypothetical protein ACFPAF_09175 [Hymenobacter endophyticus]|uniref:DUF3592 domain-containing protein n=1 Tax=Hymenobacter endophyticus TaxID=3076335 RepID=A0ABU3TGQ3_9BACT|nr:hypothetical protein [Hymenobacter endophyticus]MDU0370559.1 hypothetical protein [Hymenobacter endophyticus]